MMTKHQESDLALLNSFFSFYVSFRLKTLGIGGLISIIISFSLIIFASGSPTFYLLLAALYIFSLIDLWVLYKAISGDRL